MIKYLIILVIMVIITLLYKGEYMSSHKQAIITHSKSQMLDLPLYQKRIKSKNNLTLSLDETAKLLSQLSEFELGKFLLQHQGLNGYWTSYIILHGAKQENLSELEAWILNSAPIVLATRERFYIFRQQLQNYLKNGVKLASVPCGLMDDLLGLDYSNFVDITLNGIDLDQKSLDLASDNALLYNNQNASFFKKDAWHLEIHGEYDIITSNGLNIYEPDDQKINALYIEFFNALKPGGVLITSFLTPPPTMSTASTWHNYNAGDLAKQKAIFSDIIETGWQTFRTEAQTLNQLEQAGFHIVEVIYDSQGMFPTIVARK